MTPALSVLDLAPVTTAIPPSAALRNCLDLARTVDRLGYRRHWLAEHHNLPAVASAAPSVLIGQIAAVTERIRVGSGGIMLPNHAPLAVAETFKTLEALFPGRIDLGLGRAPGTDPVTAMALRRRQTADEADDFLDRLQELIALDSGQWPEGHPLRRVRAMPTDTPLPPIWLLGSSGYSARLAAALGLGFAFAHHFGAYDTVAAMRSYREEFRPSVWLDRPHAILAVSVLCAESDAEADRLAATLDLSYLRLAKGALAPLESPEDAAAHPFSEADRDWMRRARARHFVGSPATVRAGIEALLAEAPAEEVMIATAAFDHEVRKRSYALVAEAFGLVPAPATL
ncbi:MAG TPA: LLM class flavin-dependent oxidoreductase [Alphaproteobacteria bacterium]|nr:LLM class flavin-dependent oxidoreductase [Alphaproteobacteria bacterium]